MMLWFGTDRSARDPNIVAIDEQEPERVAGRRQDQLDPSVQGSRSGGAEAEAVPVSRIEVMRDPLASDPAIDHFQRSLEHLFTAEGRASCVERTDILAIQQRKKLNRRGVKLSDSESAQLQEILRPLDQEVSDARFYASCEQYRAAEQAVRRGDYQVASPSTRESKRSFKDVAARFPGEVLSVGDVPGPTWDTRRIIVLRRHNSPDFLDARDRLDEAMAKRDRAIAAFFAGLQR